YLTFYTPTHADFSSRSFIQGKNEGDIPVAEGFEFKIGFDLEFQQTRLIPLFSGEKLPLKDKIQWEYVVEKEHFFLYTVIFYKDQDDNLYDTVCQFFIRPDDEVKGKHGTPVNQYFHKYSKEEHNSLFNYLKDRHPMADYIGEMK
ncbi:MAG: hypothetical protein GY863_05460, partial [bacterium]|nr:hypothetical protein [bacterium]